MTDQQQFFFNEEKKKNQNIDSLQSTDVCVLERDISSGLLLQLKPGVLKVLIWVTI